MAGNSHRCQGCCKIATDDFNRADGDSLGANWVEDSGDADISSNELLFTASGGVVIFQTNHPGGADAPRRVKVRFKMPSGGGILQIYIAYTDVNNRVEAFVQTNATCASINLVKYEAGVQTYLNPDGTANSAQIAGDGVPDDEWHTFEVCLHPGGDGYYSPYPYGDQGVFRAKLTLASGKVYGTQFTGSLAGGLKVGLQGSADVRVDDFYFGWMKDEETACKGRCPNCNTPCLIEEDDFNRADSSDLGCKWTEISGLWEIASNELECTSAGIALCRVFHPQLKTHHHVTASLYVDATKTPRILVNAKSDGSSYHWAQLSWNDATDTLTLTIGKDGTTLDTVTSTLAAGGFVAAAVCYDGGILVASANGSLIYAISAPVDDGIYAGLEGRAGQERFDDFVFTKAESESDPPDPNCPDCSSDIDSGTAVCDGCETGNMSLEFLLTGNWGDGGMPCGETCRLFEALLLTAGVDPTTQCTGCGAGINVCGFIGDRADVVVCITTNRIEVLYRMEGNVGFADGFVKYRKDYAGPIPCLEFDDEPIPFHSFTDLNGFSGNTAYCQVGAPSHVFLTAL